MPKVQYIHDSAGNPQYVVLPIAEYENLLKKSESVWEELPYTADEHDDIAIPDEVVGIMIKQDVSLLAAWRIYAGLSQHEVAEKLGTTQSAVSQWEASDSKPQMKTRKKLAKLYGCLPEQMIL